MTLENREAARIVYRMDGPPAAWVAKSETLLDSAAGLATSSSRLLTTGSSGRAGEQINTSEFGCRIHKNVGNILLSRGGEARGERWPPAGATYLVASAARPSVPPGSSSSRVSRCCRRTPPPLRAGLTLPLNLNLIFMKDGYLYKKRWIRQGAQ